MDIKTLNELTDLIESYQKLIKIQNDALQEKEEIIIMLKKYINLQEVEKELVKKSQYVELLNPCLN